jgi:hypothetical protein
MVAAVVAQAPEADRKLLPAHSATRPGSCRGGGYKVKGDRSVTSASGGRQGFVHTPEPAQHDGADSQHVSKAVPSPVPAAMAYTQCLYRKGRQPHCHFGKPTRSEEATPASSAGAPLPAARRQVVRAPPPVWKTAAEVPSLHGKAGRKRCWGVLVCSWSGALRTLHKPSALSSSYGPAASARACPF